MCLSPGGSPAAQSILLRLAKTPAELCLGYKIKRALVWMCKHGLSHGACEVPHLRRGIVLTKERGLGRDLLR